MKRYVFLGIILLLAFWQLISVLGIFSPLVLPSPTKVGVALFKFAMSASALADLGMTAYRFVLCFFGSAVLGILLGIMISRFPKLGHTLSLPLDFFRSLPAPALFPVFMLFLGIGDLSRIGLTIFSVMLIVAVYTNHGIQNCPQIKIRAAHAAGVQGFDLFSRVILREARPEISTGLRISLSVTLILIVVLEMLAGSTTGLGKRIYDDHLMFRIAEMYASIFVVGLFGYMLNRLYLIWHRHYVHWAGK